MQRTKKYKSSYQAKTFDALATWYILHKQLTVEHAV